MQLNNLFTHFKIRGKKQSVFFSQKSGNFHSMEEKVSTERSAFFKISYYLSEKNDRITILNL